MGANNLKDIRKSKGLTMMDMAEILGYKYAGSYRKLETGEQELRVSQINILSKTLKITKEKILK